jgi:hypothetical protein
MTNPTDTTEVVEADADDPAVPAAPAADAASQDEQDAEDQGDGGPVHRQAAKWRKRSRELEAEVSALTDTITGLRRERAEGIAEQFGVKPAALWACTALEALLADDGTIDRDKVREAVNNAAEALGVKPKPTGGLHIPQEGRIPAPPIQNGRTRWDDAFKPNTRK